MQLTIYLHARSQPDNRTTGRRETKLGASDPKGVDVPVGVGGRGLWLPWTGRDLGGKGGVWMDLKAGKFR